MPSLAALAGSQGYESTAFHPYQSSGWNRAIVYSNMRFDHQMYQEDVEDPYLIGGISPTSRIMRSSMRSLTGSRGIRPSSSM